MKQCLDGTKNSFEMLQQSVNGSRERERERERQTETEKRNLKQIYFIIQQIFLLFYFTLITDGNQS